MHVVLATDGSRSSLEAARYLRALADPARVEAVSVVAVVRPLAPVGFADEVTPAGEGRGGTPATFREAASSAARAVAAELAGWGPAVHPLVRSGVPATEIVRLARDVTAGLVIVASGGRGLADRVPVGSTVSRVQREAPCPVLVVRGPGRPLA